MPASITATTSTPCPCCSLPHSLQCRTIGGTATLCGHSEFPNATGGVSTPPKKYLVKTATGTLDDCAYTGSTCSGSPSSAKYVYSGSCSYSATTCATTNTLLYEQYNDAGTCPATTFTTNAAQACSWGDTTDPATSDAITTITVSKTAVDRAGSGNCVIISFGASSLIRTGSMAWTLSTEDTEDNAITRLNAGASWSAWGTVGTCTNPACCLASYETRTAGFSFAHQDAQARVTATGLTPGNSYTANIQLWRRVIGVGSYVWYQTASVSGTADGAGALTTAAVTITNTKGYETYAKSSSLNSSP